MSTPNQPLTPLPATPAPTLHSEIDELLHGASTSSGQAPRAATYVHDPTHDRTPAQFPVTDPRAPSPATSTSEGVSAAPHSEFRGRPRIDRLLDAVMVHNGSDLHLAGGHVPRARIRTNLDPIASEPPTSDDEIYAMLAEILTPHQLAELKRGDLDTSYAIPAPGDRPDQRFRVNVFKAGGRWNVSVRVIAAEAKSATALGLLPEVAALSRLGSGLVIFCGATSMGKSTTMTSLIDAYNEREHGRIITFEDPVEYLHQSKRCLVSQREIGVDVESFAHGLRQVKRQNPNLISIGEMRDLETIRAGIDAADSGHLVYTTLHAQSAPQAITRIVNSFPPGQQDQIRTTLADSLVAVVAQKLLPALDEARGMVLAQEVLTVTPAVANSIRLNEIAAITGSMTNRSTGSITLEAHLAALVQGGAIALSVAERAANSPEAFAIHMGQPTR